MNTASSGGQILESDSDFMPEQIGGVSFNKMENRKDRQRVKLSQPVVTLSK